VLPTACRHRRTRRSIRLHARSPEPSRRSQRALDGFVFFVADVLTGFGPFVAVYLTSERWTQLDIGLVLTTGSLVALAGQMPGGALVDAARSERLVAGLAISLIGASALGPAIAAISLGLVGHAGLGERLGRNARFASLGTGAAAIAMGASGYFLSTRAVLFVTAAFVLPALVALSFIREEEIDPVTAHGGSAEQDAAPHRRAVRLRSLVRRRALVVFAACVMLFQLANAAMLPLMASAVTTRASQWATVLVAACIVVPQVVVAVMAPSVGRSAQRWGRRPLLLVGFAMVPLRGILFAAVTDPYWYVAVQLFDGITASVFGVMVPLVVADVTRGTARFNLSLGIVGTATGIGASLSTTLAGYVSDHLGSSVAFLGLAGIAAAGLALVWTLMPETRPAHQREARATP
jgi:Major Facilitator Superfamily